MSRLSKHIILKHTAPYVVVVVVVVVYCILSRLLYLAYSTNLGLLCMPHPGMGPLVERPFRKMYVCYAHCEII